MHDSYFPSNPILLTVPTIPPFIGPDAFLIRPKDGYEPDPTLTRKLEEWKINESHLVVLQATCQEHRQWKRKNGS